MIRSIEERIRRLEAQLLVHAPKKRLLSGWFHSELESQGWVFDSDRLISVTENETNANPGRSQ